MPIEAPLAAQAPMPGHPATDHQRPSASALHPPRDPAPGSLVDQVGGVDAPAPPPSCRRKAGLCTEAAIGRASHAEPLPSSTVTPLRNDRSTSVG